MSKKGGTERREAKLARELRALAVTSPNHLKFTWEKMLEAWSLEAFRRGRLTQLDNATSEVLPVFDVLCKAERLLTLCGHKVERLVGQRTRQLLSYDCSKAFALAVDPNMYHLSVNLRPPKRKQSGATPKATKLTIEQCHEHVAVMITRRFLTQKIVRQSR